MTRTNRMPPPRRLKKNGVSGSARKKKPRGPDGVGKLGVKWKNNPDMKYYKTTSKQDAKGARQAFYDLLSRCFDGKEHLAEYAAYWINESLQVEWTSHFGVWKDATKKPANG